MKTAKCPIEPHYQLMDWEVTGVTELGLPIQTLFAHCLSCGSKTAMAISTTQPA
jgi:hypothetical protein